MEVSSPFANSHGCIGVKYDLEIYTQLMNTWNGFPSRYWEKVLGTVRAGLGEQIRETGVNSAPSKPIDTRGISYNQAAMEALLGEPEVEQPKVARVEIPEASSVYFDAEGGVGNIEGEEDTALPAVVEEVADEIFEEGCRKFEEKYGLNPAA